jgi:hypothetical protein
MFPTALVRFSADNNTRIHQRKRRVNNENTRIFEQGTQIMPDARAMTHGVVERFKDACRDLLLSDHPYRYAFVSIALKAIPESGLQSHIIEDFKSRASGFTGSAIFYQPPDKKGKEIFEFQRAYNAYSMDTLRQKSQQEWSEWQPKQFLECLEMLLNDENSKTKGYKSLVELYTTVTSFYELSEQHFISKKI